MMLSTLREYRAFHEPGHLYHGTQFYATKFDALIPFVSAENVKNPSQWKIQSILNSRISYIGIKLSKDLQKVPHVHK